MAAREAPDIAGDGRHTLELRLAGELIGRYRYGPELARPHLEALFAPGGRLVTRATRPGDDHPHHRGVWAGHRDVDGVDHWTEFPGHGRIVHRAFARVRDEGFVERLDWLDPGGRAALGETRAIRASAPGTIDFEFRLRAGDRAVTLGDAKDAALLAVRVAPTMRTIENAAGGRGEAECWGRRAAWCDCSGPVDGEVVGIAVLDHPRNPRHPTPWHVRDYGLLAANPFGFRALEVAAHDRSAADDRSTARHRSPERDGSLDSAAGDGSVRLAPGAEIAFRYRVIVHEGDAAAARIADRHREYGS